MADIREVYEIWSNIDFDTLVDESIKENEPEIIDAQVDQMKHGLNADGSLIGQYATTPGGEPSEYAKAKNAQNSLPGLGNVDLILTGDFSENIILKYDKTFIQPISTDEKNEKLTTGNQGYGANVFGLMKEKLAELVQNSILPTFLKRFRIAAKV